MAGARGYVNKRMAGSQIADVIRKIMDGEVYLNEETKQDIINRTFAGDPSRPRPSIRSLSDRELEIFRLVGQGLTSLEIAERIKLSRKTVEALCQNLHQVSATGQHSKACGERLNGFWRMDETPFRSSSTLEFLEARINTTFARELVMESPTFSSGRYGFAVARRTSQCLHQSISSS